METRRTNKAGLVPGLGRLFLIFTQLYVAFFLIVFLFVCGTGLHWALFEWSHVDHPTDAEMIAAFEERREWFLSLTTEKSLTELLQWNDDPYLRDRPHMDGEWAVYATKEMFGGITLSIPRSSFSVIGGGSFKGYYWSRRVPRDLVEDVDKASSKRRGSCDVYRSLGDGWYICCNESS